jgi:hypothetical protein
VLRSTRPDALTGRPIAIAVLDLDTAGPAFGARSLAALGTGGAPLDGLDVRFERVHYDWNDTAILASRLDDLKAAGHLVAISSEGGLFEYGSDAAISATLATVRDHADADTIVVGSVTRGDGVIAEIQTERMFATIPRSVDQFRALADAGGWVLDEIVEGPLSRQIRLTSVRRS